MLHLGSNICGCFDFPIFFYTFISLSSKSYMMKFFLQFLTLVHNYKRCRNSCFHIQLVRSQGIQNYAMLPERYTPQALFKKLNLEYLTIYKNNIENIKVIFLNNRFLVDAVESNLIPNLLHLCYRTFGQVLDRWLAVHLVF